MANLTVSTHVAAPLQETFDIYTDLAHAAERIPAITKIEMLSDGPFGNGTRWRETRVVMKKESTEEMWVTGFDPPHRYQVEADTCGCLYQTLFTFEADGEGTKVTWSFGSTPKTLAAKVLSPVFGVLFKGMMKKCLVEDLEALRDFAQSKRDA